MFDALHGVGRFHVSLPEGEFKGSDVFSLKNPQINIRFVGEQARGVLWNTSVLLEAPPIVLYKYFVTKSVPSEKWLAFFDMLRHSAFVHPGVISTLLEAYATKPEESHLNEKSWNIFLVRGVDGGQYQIGARNDSGWTLSKRLRNDGLGNSRETVDFGDCIICPLDFSPFLTP